MDRLFEVFLHNERRASIAAQLIVLMMMICVAIACVMAAGWAFSNFTPDGMVMLGFLVSAEALYSYRHLRSLRASNESKPYHRLAEWVLIVLLLKVFTEIRFGLDHLIQNIVL